MQVAPPPEALGSAESWCDVSPPGPCAMVIFGVTGDLASRLLFPALCNLAHHNLLPQEFAVVGFALPEVSEQELRQNLVKSLKAASAFDSEVVDRLVSRLRFVGSDFESAAGWQQLKQILSDFDRDYQTGGNYLFYLATAPAFFLSVTERLGQEGLLAQQDGQWRR